MVSRRNDPCEYCGTTDPLDHTESCEREDDAVWPADDQALRDLQREARALGVDVFEEAHLLHLWDEGAAKRICYLKRPDYVKPQRLGEHPVEAAAFLRGIAYALHSIPAAPVQ